jgi:alpha-tubulin suppressor-like RCC1 family protein
MNIKTLRKDLCQAAMMTMLFIGTAVGALGQTVDNVKAWGSSDFGQLGNGVTFDYNFDNYTPTAVVGLSNVKALAAGAAFSLALKNDGTVWQWGSINDTNVPGPVDGLTGVVAIAAGGYSDWDGVSPGALALKSDGTVWAWGYYASQPTKVPGLTDVAAVAQGVWCSLALKKDGTVWGWDSCMDTPTGAPVQVSNLTGVTAIAASWEGMALKSDGTVWVQEDYGSDQWTQVSNLNGVVAIAPGLALKSDGTLWNVGVNYGPVLALTSVVKISDGLAIRSDGTVWDTPNDTWAQISGLNGVVSVAGRRFWLKEDHSLALKSDGTVWGWGSNRYGQRGNGGSMYSKVPRTVRDLPGAVSVSAGGVYSLALKSDGTVWAWGCEWRNGDTGDPPGACGQYHGAVPVAVKATNGDAFSGAVSIAAGGTHSLLLKAEGTVWAWGHNNHGQVGNGEINDNYMCCGVENPVAVRNLTSVVAVAAGELHSLALKKDGTVWAWGWNGFGQLGNGNRVRSTVPVAVSKLTGVIAIAAGHNFSLALRSDGTVWGWGANFTGQLGNGTNTSSNVPVAMLDLTGGIAIAAGFGRSLAIRNDGTVWASGCPFTTSYPCSNAPIAVSNLTTIVGAAAGYGHNLALKSDGTLWAWGDNGYGVLGDGTYISRKAPVKVVNLTNAMGIAAGERHSLAVVKAGIPVVALDSKALNFGNQPAGSTSLIQSINLANSGEKPLQIHNVNLTGIDPSQFTKTADTCTAAILTPGGSCGISVTFTPQGQGARSGALLITSNAPGSSHLVTLKGTGIGGVSIPVTVTAPNRAEKLFTGTPYTIQWTTPQGQSITKFDVHYSTNGGASFTALPGCTALAGSARTCVWKAPRPATTKGRIRVTASDAPGNTGSDISDANFNVVSGKASITITAPNTAVKWAAGSVHPIKWTSNLGAAAFVNLSLSRDAGLTWQPLAARVPNTGTYSWNVTGPATTKARVRASWAANDSIMDLSNVNFTITQSNSTGTELEP